MPRFLPIVIVMIALFATQLASACTGIVVSDRDQVLVGNNEDWFNMRTKIWFTQPAVGRYGGVYFGFDNLSPQGGMNQQGLFFDIFALREREAPRQTGKPTVKRDLMREMMATCATVKEALALIDQYQKDFLDRRQVFIADATGDAAIIEGNAVVRKNEDHLIVTNFRQSKNASGPSDCRRYRIAQDLLKSCTADRFTCIRRILAATHQEGAYPTLYSNIYDLTAKTVHVYYFHNYEEPIVIDLERVLEKSTGVRDLSALFPPNYAAEEQAARYTRLTKSYAHSSPRFVVRYPDVYDDTTPDDGTLAFQATSRIGALPVLTISVSVEPDAVTLSQVAGEIIMARLRQLGTHVRVLANFPVKLADGAAAYESRFTWKHKGRTRLNSLVLSTYRDGRLVTVGLHNMGELDYLKHIPYSLRFNE